jgi:hypothetical protein
MASISPSPKLTAKKGRLFSHNPLSQEELNRRVVENKTLYTRCYPIFQEIQSKFMKDHYDWFVVIEPDSGDYIMDADEDIALQKAIDLFPNQRLITFCLNETGACGKI